MSIKTLLIDDNPFILELLKDHLAENHKHLNVVGIATNGEEGIEMIHSLKPELLFLDVEMPDMTGFEMLNTVTNIDFKTIFITSHSHYAIKAIRFNALDYLLKPFNTEELKNAINRFSNQKNRILNQEKVKNALSNQKVKHIKDQTLLLPNHSGTLRLKLKSIKYIEGDRNYSKLILQNGNQELSSKNLGYFEDILGDFGFFRCHRSMMINQHFIEKMENQAFFFQDGTSIEISRRKLKSAKEWFHHFREDRH
ncbi:LytR/AlgR family response regulator transcription factor [Mangrovimonas xylaniphaga]|uniref:LytR/AlgR family response regulator transcription factor n=1 Tax=Mangrovimonas xylaniphaga TaxID=1645915 RepID=UPI0006B4DE8E|nr:LytTR family DNA-binding domain-containing protein [Mangrovimonas xylaniphaga]